MISTTPKLVAVALVIVFVVSLVGSLELFPAQTYAFSSPATVAFSASMNSTSITQSQALGVSVTDTNYLPFPNEPPAYGTFPDNASAAPCDFSSPFGAAAFQGRYVQSNISAAKKLEVFDEYGFYSCPAMFSGDNRLWPFQSATRQLDISGYWTNGTTLEPGSGFSEGVLHPFPTGTYTLLIADAWGHVKLLYFQVT